MTGSKILSFLKKYMMLIALVAVVIFFNIATSGRALYAQNITNLIVPLSASQAASEPS